MRRGSTARVLALCGALLSIAAPRAAAQDPAPEEPTSAPAPASPDSEPSPDYFVPNLAAGTLLHDGKRISIKPIVAIVLDYTWFDQDDASLEQVGTQEDSPDVRAARIGLYARSKGERAWTFTFTADYQEQRTRDDATFQVYDVRLDIPFGPVNLTLGKQKEPFGLEMVGLMPRLPQQERILSPFYVTRNTGVQLSGQLGGGRMTWGAGAFNDWLETGASLNRNATDFVARVTGLPSVSPDSGSYLHLGLGVRHAGSDEGMMRFSGRPESHVADKYLDTGDFPAEHANLLGLEAAWSRTPVTLSVEHVQGWVSAPESGNPRFSGSYVTASWVVTGEARPYLRALGTPAGSCRNGASGRLSSWRATATAT